MCKIKISAVIPVYNAEKFIGDCIESVLRQTFQDWELLLVDDGSTDSSLIICNYYAQTDTRIRVFHQENRGVSAARNFGIECAKGDYIQFLDADDTIDIEYMENLYKGVADFDADICVGNAAMVYARDGTIISERKSEIQAGLFTLWEFLQFYPQYVRNCLFGASWNKLYKRSILLENSIRFDVNLKNNEDTRLNYDYLLNCNTVYVSNRPYYNYFSRENHISASKKSLVDLFEIYVGTYDRACYFLERTNTFDQHIRFQSTYFFDLVIGAMNRIINGKLNYSRSEKITGLRSICDDEHVCFAVRNVSCITIDKRVILFLTKMRCPRLLYCAFLCRRLLKRIRG